MIADAATADEFARLAAKPEFAASRDSMNDAVAKIRAAMARGDKLAEIETIDPAEDKALRQELWRGPKGPKLAAIIDRQCFSSCMAFLIELRARAGTLLLGEPTLGYSTYGEINGFDLPSGQGKIYLPSALYRAPQAPREPFFPDYSPPKPIESEAEYRAWVAETLNHIKH
jgi:hypothetical protein